MHLILNSFLTTHALKSAYACSMWNNSKNHSINESTLAQTHTPICKDGKKAT